MENMNIKKDYDILGGSLTQMDIMDNLPIIPCYVLLACYMAAFCPKGKDAVILGLIKRSLQDNSTTGAPRGKQGLFELPRAIWIVEALIVNQEMREPVNDLGLVYHSNEFFLSFHFFERLNWVRDLTTSRKPFRYRFTCDHFFVNKVIKKLGFDAREFIVN